jgi:hypothetical protein
MATRHLERISFDTLSILKEMGSVDEVLTFDGLVRCVNGLDDLETDGITIDEANIVLALDNIGVSEPLLNQFMSDRDKNSTDAFKSISKSVDEQLDYDDISDLSKNISNTLNLDDVSEISFDSTPQGYRRKMVVRGGKKVWINKRNPNKKVRLSIKQKMALAKARLKAHSSSANAHRAKSNKLRKLSRLR